MFSLVCGSIGVTLQIVAQAASPRQFNHPSLWWFFNKVKRLWLASLKRRSQTARLT
jgi:hypothetical protein